MYYYFVLFDRFQEEASLWCQKEIRSSICRRLHFITPRGNVEKLIWSCWCHWFADSRKFECGSQFTRFAQSNASEEPVAGLARQQCRWLYSLRLFFPICQWGRVANLGNAIGSVGIRHGRRLPHHDRKYSILCGLSWCHTWPSDNDRYPQRVWRKATPSGRSSLPCPPQPAVHFH